MIIINKKKAILKDYANGILKIYILIIIIKDLQFNQISA